MFSINLLFMKNDFYVLESKLGNSPNFKSNKFISKILSISTEEYEKCLMQFNAIFSMQDISGSLETFTYFTNKKDAEDALKWIESMQLLNKLSVNDNDDNITLKGFYMEEKFGMSIFGSKALAKAYTNVYNKV